MAYISFQPKDYFNNKLYIQSGSNNNGNTQTLTMDNVGWVWIKNRDFTNGHCLFDIVRGGDKLLATNGNAAAETAGGGITFGSSDTTIGADTGGYGFNNRVGDDYVAWHWRASGTSGSSNTNGAITSTVSASTTSGFSIVKYTGNGVDNSSIGHGLNSAPEMIILKGYSGAENWMVYHKGLTAGYEILLNSTAAESDDSFNATWGDNHPTNVTSSTFEVGYAGDANGSGTDYIAYCFHSVKGFSNFGSYTGNGSVDGTFVYTGFKPAWFMVKRTNAVEGWYIYDVKRDTFNVSDAYLFANASSAEATLTNGLDILSNGFKMRNTDTGHNASGSTYIYMAFAEEPLVSSNKVPATAR
jgi:hypothetical protein